MLALAVGDLVRTVAGAALAFAHALGAGLRAAVKVARVWISGLGIGGRQRQAEQGDGADAQQKRQFVTHHGVPPSETGAGDSGLPTGAGSPVGV